MDRETAQLEFGTLRDEYLRRSDARQQMISLVLGLASGFAGIGWTVGAVVLFMYPLLALLLGLGWAQNELHIGQITAYLNGLESRLPGLGWQSYRKSTGVVLFGLPMDALAVAGMLVLTQLLAFGLGFYQFALYRELIHWIMFLVALAAVAGLFMLILFVRARLTALMR